MTALIAIDRSLLSVNMLLLVNIVFCSYFGQEAKETKISALRGVARCHHTGEPANASQVNILNLSHVTDCHG